jgi:eukaryotic-like serine/threonine-protein kinase
MDDLRDRLNVALADQYRIDRELGGGGMSRVFVAEELQLGRQVVLKVLPPDLAAGLSVERFRREIQLAAQLQHPNIVPLHAAGRADGLLYYTMPLVEGESLRNKLTREGEQPVREVIRILRDVADALAYAHEHGVVHRDIKPDNVLVSRHHGLVTDFGVAKALVSSSGAKENTTSIGVALGTPAYMAPEQAAADPHADHRADIYAFGVLGYEMLANRPPFTGPTPQVVLASQVTERPRPIEQLRASVPVPLARLIMRCLEKKPADRFQTADEILQELESLATPSGGMAPTQATIVPRKRRNLLKLAVPLIVIAAAAALLRFRLSTGSERAATKLSDSVVAVLPFRVTGADPSVAYLSEGMVDLLAARLTGEGGPRAVEPRVAIASYRREAKVDGESDEDAAIAVARRVGAGQVIDGGLVGSPSRLVLTASLRGVPSGKVRAQTSVQGPADSLATLVDQLAARLLLIGAGESDGDALGSSAPLAALRPYLQGQAAYRQGRFEEAVTSHQRALQVDSTFALAGMGLMAASTWGPPNEDFDRGARLAWAARDRLSSRDQALLEAEVGPNYPNPYSEADLLAARERAVRLAPDRPESWYHLGDHYHHWGTVLGYEDAWDRAAAALRRALELDSSFAGPLVHLTERAAGMRDTAALRRYGTLGVRLDSLEGTSEYFRLLMALGLRDSLALRTLRSGFDRMKDRTLGWISFTWPSHGLPIEDARRALEVWRSRASTRQERLGYLLFSHDLAMNAGRPKEALAFTTQLAVTWEYPRSYLHMRVKDGIYWDGDTAAAADAARQLVRSADAPLAREQDVRDRQYDDICTLEQWRLHQGNLGTVARAVTKLRTVSKPISEKEHVAFRCGLMLEAWAATLRKSPEASTRLLHLDSLLKTGPPGWFQTQQANLLASRLHELQGNLPSAVAAIRRRSNFGNGPTGYLSSFLREEGRLAALAGDRQGAIRAYQHYLALRTDPEPSLKAQVDGVRAELARLSGEDPR